MKRRVRDFGDVRLAIDGSFDISARDSMGPVPTRSIAWLGAIVVSSILTGLAVWSLTHTESPTRPDVRRFSLTLPPSLPLDNTSQVVAVSPDGTHLAFIADGRVYLRPLDQLDATPLADTRGAQSVAFSPDSQWLAFLADGSLKKVSISGGTPVTLCEVNSRGAVSWGFDDTILFVQSVGIMQVSSAGGIPDLVIAAGDGARPQSARFLDEGETLLFTVNTGSSSNEAQVVVQSLATGERRVLVNGGTSARYLAAGYLV